MIGGRGYASREDLSALSGRPGSSPSSSLVSLLCISEASLDRLRATLPAVLLISNIRLGPKRIKAINKMRIISGRPIPKKSMAYNCYTGMVK